MRLLKRRPRLAPMSKSIRIGIWNSYCGTLAGKSRCGRRGVRTMRTRTPWYWWLTAQTARALASPRQSLCGWCLTTRSPPRSCLSLPISRTWAAPWAQRTFRRALGSAASSSTSGTYSRRAHWRATASMQAWIGSPHRLLKNKYKNCNRCCKRFREALKLKIES